MSLESLNSAPGKVEVASLEKKVYVPQEIPTPDNTTALPSVDEYPSLYDIHASLAQAEKEMTWITGIVNQKEQRDRIGYLKLLLNNSPEKIMVDKENKIQGADAFHLSFSQDQALFMRNIAENRELDSLETMFYSTLDKVEYEKGVITTKGYGHSDADRVRYCRDMFAYGSDRYKKLGQEQPQWFISSVEEFEKLFPRSPYSKGYKVR